MVSVAVLLLLACGQAGAFVPRPPPRGGAPGRRGARLRSTVDDASFEDEVKPKLRYSSADWLPNLISIPQSKILQRVSPHIKVNVAFAAAFAALCRAGVAHPFSPLAHTLSAGALGFLLVFRTNAAYDRWWEARKAWGRILFVSRDLARCASFMGSKRAKMRLGAALCAFPVLLRLHVTAADFSARHVTNRPRAAHTQLARRACIEAHMPADDARRVVDAKHRALECTRVLGDAVRAGFVGDDAWSTADPHQKAVERNICEQHVIALSECMGVCERILNAPVPLSYSRHTSRFLTVWLGTLPLVLPMPPVAVVAVIATMSWALLSIEEIAHIIEEPFNFPFEPTPTCPRTSLAMEAISEAVAADVRAAIPQLDQPPRRSRDAQLAQ